MKKILYILTVFMIGFLYSCEPQMDNIPNIGEAPVGDISIDDSNPNSLVFEANSNNGFMYNWDFGNGSKSQKKVATSYYPFVGTYVVTCIISGKGGSTEIEQTIVISQNDPDVREQPFLKELTNTGAGKTWVYDTDNDAGYFYMTANYDWEEFWWQPADDGDLPAGIASELMFDLNGGYNYTLSPNANTIGEMKSFVLDNEEMTLTLINSNLPDVDDENLNPDRIPKNVFQIQILTDGELLLWQDQQNDDYAWAWRFKPKD
ncbi:MAG: PKD domain-containing protein [Flavobacteriaceae bacterium]|nr:PKD domain-containing protein [Flavobacteriaceae bacterium]